MNIENKKALLKISKNITKLYVSKFMSICHEQDWSTVYACANAINDLKGVDDVELSAGRYVNYIDFEGDKDPYRDYDLTITTHYGKLSGYIRCFPAGTVSDKFSSYDMLVYIYPVKAEDVNESIDLNNILEKALKLFKEQLKKAKTFAEIKKISKDAIRKGLLVGTVATMIFGNIAYNQHLFKEIMTELNDIEQRVNDIENKFLSEEPQWELVSDHTTATVYHAVPLQCNKDVAHTASMFEINLTDPLSHKIIAMERTMMKDLGLKYGDLVRVEGTKGYDDVYQILDTMNKRFAGKHKIDILINKTSKQGIWNNVNIYKLVNKNACGAELRNNMAPAKNQAKIDKRQGNVNEAFNFDLDDLGLSMLDTDSDNDIRLSKVSGSKQSVNKINKIESENIKELTLDLIIKHWINSGYTMLDDGTELTGEIIVMKSSDCNVHGILKNPNIKTDKSEKLVVFACSDRNTKFFFLVNIDKLELYIITVSAWSRSKWFTLNTPMIKMIEDANLFNKVYVGLGDVLFSERISKRATVVCTCDITENLSLYRTRYNSELYFLPMKYHADDDFSKFIFSDEFLNKNWEFIINPIEDNIKPSELWQALFKSKEDYKKMAMKFIDKGFPVIDEYETVYETEADLDNLISSDDSAKNAYNEELNEKRSTLEAFLTTEIGNDGIIAYKESLKNVKKYSQHFYLRTLYKNRKKKSDPYAKLDRSVLQMILNDNNIDIDSLSTDLIKKSFDMAIDVFETKNKEFKSMPEYTQQSARREYLHNEYIDSLIKQRCPMFFIYNTDELNTLGYDTNDPNIKIILNAICHYSVASISNVRSELLSRAFYKMNQVLYRDNPNGWNNRRDNECSLGIITDSRYNEGVRYSYYSSSESRPYDWDNLSLAIDTTTDLFYAYYMLGFAITNAYNDIVNLRITGELDKFDNNMLDPKLLSINFNSFSKSLHSGFNTIVKNSK